MTKTALVTGANRGIGREIAKQLREQGISVVLAARDAEAGQAAAKGIGARFFELDVADRASIENAARRLDRIDILVNNAGILQHGGLFDDPADLDRCLDVMTRGPFHLMRLFAPRMMEQRWGRIVNVSSGWGSFAEGLRGPGGYGVAKAALNALTFVAAQELPQTVKVNAMCPGWVRTRMGGPNATTTPEEAADTAVWLATLPDDGPTGGFFRQRRPIRW
ncbi:MULTISPECIES: SDR family NAD(P)-dependent oxidoreductase [unclassified Roseitalea]|uniref:SDR family NAD(P)-dependent oxidoreductase n=1 Tax=unclassified Roseitalea TaxID=2639107 RepID=UPI00273FD680|nr:MULTISPECIES: SDR family NAD(P)-dependent oxidoreductase [unclassified Roseitalea]